MKYLLCFAILLYPSLCAGQAVRGHEQISDRVNITVSDGTLSIRPLTDNAVRITFVKDADARLPELVFTAGVHTPAFSVSDQPSRLEVRLNQMVVVLDKQDGNLSFEDTAGKIFLSERGGTRYLVPDTATGERRCKAELTFDSPADESLFGLGQFQDGHFNVKGVTRRMAQVNSQIAIPFVYSTRGYGLLWHQYGLTDFNPADNAVPLAPGAQQGGQDASTADVTTSAGTAAVPQGQSLFRGRFTVPRSGRYAVFLDLGDMGNRHFVAIDGTACVDQSNYWLPPCVSAFVNLAEGEHQVEIVCKSSNTPSLFWREVGPTTTFRSPHASCIDYTVFYGASADSVIKTYRTLSGAVPMLPRWAFGFWQCRERYTSGEHLVRTVRTFRERGLPMDAIVQDWQYWGKYGWGVPRFDETSYPDPAGFISTLHGLHARFAVSVWENVDKNSAIGRDYLARALYIPDSPWLDMTDPLAREAHWQSLRRNLFDVGVDAWWMDATEPENDALKNVTTHLGSGNALRLIYPLFTSRMVYEGQRAASREKRVCILTRSAFPGQQRYGTINWSGDIAGTWDGFRRQITAGLGYAMTGMPFWTTDVGGFFRPGPAQYRDTTYHELLTRWFQWGAFNPLFRVHGYQSETEPWMYGPAVEANMKATLALRYRLLPYIYALASQVSDGGTTMMRPLVMDFRDDPLALEQRYAHMFGPAFLVVPVTEPGGRPQHIYLPGKALWYDFWTGKSFSGSQTLHMPAPEDHIPVFVKAGSIVPLGPVIQYSGERSDPIEIRIYPGADGMFTLYEDEGDSYRYEQGQCTRISLVWNDRDRTLSIGERNGAYRGMPDGHTFHVTVVGPGRGCGSAEVSEGATTIRYTGSAVHVVVP